MKKNTKRGRVHSKSEKNETEADCIGTTKSMDAAMNMFNLTRILLASWVSCAWLVEICWVGTAAYTH